MSSGSLGVWADQIDEMMAEANAHFEAGNAMALDHMVGAMLRSIRLGVGMGSPCPNALVVALNYAQAALDLVEAKPTPREHWEVATTRMVEDARKRWGQVDLSRRGESYRRAAERLALQGKTPENWLTGGE